VIEGHQLPPGELAAVFGDAAAGRDVVVEPLPHAAVASATTGLWRVRAADRTAVVKVVAHGPDRGSENWRSGADESHWYYWRREADAYGSGLLDRVGDVGRLDRLDRSGRSGRPGAAGLRAPRCHLVAERRDGSVALWLEDVAGEPASSWSIDRYGIAARHLGRAQGAFAVGRPLPADPWLSHDWLRRYLEQPMRALPVPTAPEPWRHPLLAPWFPEPPVAALQEMRADRDRFLAGLDRMPATLCHHDFHPANLFSGVVTADETTVAIDWSFVGIGPLGEDAGNLVPDAVLDFHVAPEQLTALYEAVAEGYIAGLREAGWTGDDHVVRLAMAATMAAKYAWIGPTLARAVGDGRDVLNGRPLADAVGWWAPTVSFLLERAGEARELSGHISSFGSPSTVL
jgi:Phosphotransferase enzyme family